MLRIRIRAISGISSSSSSLSLLLNAEATVSFFTVSTGLLAESFSCTGWTQTYEKKRKIEMAKLRIYTRNEQSNTLTLAMPDGLPNDIETFEIIGGGGQTNSSVSIERKKKQNNWIGTEFGRKVQYSIKLWNLSICLLNHDHEKIYSCCLYRYLVPYDLDSYYYCCYWSYCCPYACSWHLRHIDHPVNEIWIVISSDFYVTSFCTGFGHPDDVVHLNNLKNWQN